MFVGGQVLTDDGVSTQARLSIAGVDVLIHCDRPLLFDGGPSYRSFLFPGSHHGGRSFAIDADVRFSFSPPNDAATVFECRDDWQMQPEGDGYRLTFRAVDGSVHTVVCSDRDTSNLQIYMEQECRRGALPGERITNRMQYPLDQIILMNHLAHRGGVACHAAGAVVDGAALVFAGASGSGKTTISQLLFDAGYGAGLLSDERVVLRRASEDPAQDPAYRAWGTPWPSDAGIAENASAPLAALLFLVKADVDELVPLSPPDAVHRLIPVVSCPWYDPERLAPVLETCAHIAETTPCYDLRFTRRGGAVPLLTTHEWAKQAE